MQVFAIAGGARRKREKNHQNDGNRLGPLGSVAEHVSAVDAPRNDKSDDEQAKSCDHHAEAMQDVHGSDVAFEHEPGFLQ